MSEFGTAAAADRAEDQPPDRHVFMLTDAAWDQFTATLARPSRQIPELAALLNQPAPWDT